MDNRSVLSWIWGAILLLAITKCRTASASGDEDAAKRAKIMFGKREPAAEVASPGEDAGDDAKRAYGGYEWPAGMGEEELSEDRAYGRVLLDQDRKRRKFMFGKRVPAAHDIDTRAFGRVFEDDKRAFGRIFDGEDEKRVFGRVFDEGEDYKRAFGNVMGVEDDKRAFGRVFDSDDEKRAFGRVFDADDKRAFGRVFDSDMDKRAFGRVFDDEKRARIFSFGKRSAEGSWGTPAEARYSPLDMYGLQDAALAERQRRGGRVVLFGKRDADKRLFKFGKRDAPWAAADKRLFKFGKRSLAE